MASKGHKENAPELNSIKKEMEDMQSYLRQMQTEAGIMCQLIDFYRGESGYPMNIEQLEAEMLLTDKRFTSAGMKMKNVLMKLQLEDENGEPTLASHVKAKMEQIFSLQEEVGTKKVDDVSVGLTQAEKLRKQSNYILKLKMCVKVYTKLNEKLAEEVKVLKSEAEQSKDKVNSLNVTSDELTQLQVKVSRYEKELLKFEKRYPWLKDPSLNLIKISKEIELLTGLREKRNKLQNELNAFHGLKPDMKEAYEQLAKLKLESKQIFNDFVKN